MRTVHVRLTVSSIDSAIKLLYNRKRWLKNRTQKFLKELAKEGINVSSVKFLQATYDGANDVSCHVEERGNQKVAVVATGKATLFIEFGTGVKYPDSHPEGQSTGMVHGSWSKSEKGKGQWDNPKGWYYEHGKRTHGNPANMCLYSTIRELEDKFEDVARRVFV